MGLIIAFVPASGGVGATSLAAATAVRAAAAQRSVVAVDLDRFGGRLDVVLGVEQDPGWRWDELAAVDGVVDGVGLRTRLPEVAGVAVLSGSPMAPGLGGAGVVTGAGADGIADVVTGLALAHDVTVLDLPRDDRVVRAVAGLVDAWVLVVGTRLAQLAAAGSAVPRLMTLMAQGPEPCDPLAHHRGALRVEPWLVLRGPRNEDLEDFVTDQLDLPVVGFVRDDVRVADDVISGIPPGLRGRGSLVEVADRVLLRLVSMEVAGCR